MNFESIKQSEEPESTKKENDNNLSILDATTEVERVICRDLGKGTERVDALRITSLTQS